MIRKTVLNPVWLSVSETAKIGGVRTKTIRRAIQDHRITYKIVKNRYFVDFASAIEFFHTNTKLRNKLNNKGVGQYIKKWRE